MKRRHAMPFGTTVLGRDGVRFRLWAPAASTVTLELEAFQGVGRLLAMPATADGWFELQVPQAGPGSRYCFVIDEQHRVPDPASRFQPQDVHGPSEVIDPGVYEWQDTGWCGRPWEEAVLYELHVGSFTPDGTFEGALRRLDDLVELGATAIELMPVADWPGRRNWGYDGVYLFAPDATLGGPEALKAFIDSAHQRNLMVFLDVVFNHFGPEGNYLNLYAPQFFTSRHRTPWGKAINFDGPDSETVRAFFVHNALYWIEEFGVDGLRLDAVHAIRDDSDPDILTSIAEAVADHIAGERHVHLVLENDDNASRYLRRLEDGRPRWYVAQWNDDLHHALHVLTTGETGGYYADYADSPGRHLGRALAEGFVYQGQPSAYRDGRPRGEPTADLPATAFVNFLQNHDQIGNRAFGERIDTLATREAVEAALCILLLSPGPPLLFMGQEWGTQRPFPFFCDFEPELANAVREGRRREFSRFPEFRNEAARMTIPDPLSEATFELAILDWAERDRPPHLERHQLCREWLAIRHRDIVPRLTGMTGGGGYEAFGEGGVRVSWALGDGSVLWLTANMSQRPSMRPATPSRGAARVLCALAIDPDATEDAVPPWSVLWELELPDGPRHG